LIEAKIIATNKGVKEVAWLEKITKDLNKVDNIVIPILRCDNLGRIDLIKDIKYYNKAKYI
jgi:hypothetical protein